MSGPRNTKAEAYRWLDAHVGATLTTSQRYPDGRHWEPGERQLDKTGKTTWSLDGSEVRITRTHVVLDITDDLLLLEWQDEDGTQIHTTAYRTAWPEVDDDDALDIIDEPAVVVHTYDHRGMKTSRCPACGTQHIYWDEEDLDENGDLICYHD